MSGEGDDAPPIAKWLTVPGRLLLIATVLGCAALFYFYFMSSYEDLPAGRYPLMLWLAPILFGGALFFFGAAWLLEKLGISIYTKSQK